MLLISLYHQLSVNLIKIGQAVSEINRNKQTDGENNNKKMPFIYNYRTHP